MVFRLMTDYYTSLHGLAMAIEQNDRKLAKLDAEAGRLMDVRNRDTLAALKEVLEAGPNCGPLVKFGDVAECAAAAKETLFPTGRPAVAAPPRARSAARGCRGAATPRREAVGRRGAAACRKDAGCRDACLSAGSCRLRKLPGPAPVARAGHPSRRRRLLGENGVLAQTRLPRGKRIRLPREYFDAMPDEQHDRDPPTLLARLSAAGDVIAEACAAALDSAAVAAPITAICPWPLS